MEVSAVLHACDRHLRVLSGEVRISERYCQILSALQSLCGEVLRAELANQVSGEQAYQNCQCQTHTCM